MQTTLLADDAFLEIIGSTNLKMHNRRHMYAIAAKLMERALRMRARTRKRVKRNHGIAPLNIDDQVGLEAVDDPTAEAAASELREVLVDSLKRLGEHYGEATRDVVILRRGCGLSVPEAARLTDVSERTVKRRTRFGLAWLVKDLKSKGYEIGDAVSP